MGCYDYDDTEFVQDYIEDIVSQYKHMKVSEFTPEQREGWLRSWEFRPVMRKGSGLVLPVKAGDVHYGSSGEKFTAATDGYLYTPLTKDGEPSNDQWIIAGDIFAATYTILPGEVTYPQYEEWQQAKKTAINWVRDFGSYSFSGVTVETLEGSQEFGEGDWLSIDVAGNVNPISEARHGNYTDVG